MKVSMKEFKNNSGGVFDKVATLGEVILTKRGEDVYIISKCIFSSELKGATLEEGWKGHKGGVSEYRLKEQGRINEWRNKAGAVESKGWHEYEEVR